MEWVVNATPRPLFPRERPGTNRTGGWVGPRARLDGCRKSCPAPEFDPWTVQSVASRYTSYAIPALFIIYYSFTASIYYRAYILFVHGDMIPLRMIKPEIIITIPET